jgi:hypothetical protein
MAPVTHNVWKSYVDLIKRYIWFHNKKRPKGMRVPEVKAFLSYLAVLCRNWWGMPM